MIVVVVVVAASSECLYCVFIMRYSYRNVDYDDRDSKPFGADAPFAVVMFMSNFLFCYDHPMRNKENRKQCNLVTLLL